MEKTTWVLISNTIYATSFFILGTAIFIKLRRASKIELINNFYLLAAFGYVHGLADSLIIPLVLNQDLAKSIPFLIFRRLLLLLSFTLLATFSILETVSNMPTRKLVFASLFPILTALSIVDVYVGIKYGFERNQLILRYVFSFPFSVLAGIAFLIIAMSALKLRMDKLSRSLKASSVFFFLYAFFGGILSPPLLGPDGTFLGIYIGVYRAISIVGLTISILFVLNLFEIE